MNTSDSFSISLFLMSFFGASKKNVALYRFHLSGTGNTAVSTGFPRLRGLVHIAKQEKQKSSLTLSLLPPYNTSEAAAINVATRLRFFRLIDFVKTCDIIYTKNMNLAWFSRWKDIYANTLKAKMLQFSRAWPFVVQWIIRDEAYPVLRQIKAQDVSSVLEWLAVKINEDLPHVIVVPSPDQHHTLLMFIVDAPPLSSDEQPFSIMQRLSVDIPENIHLSGVIGIEKIHVYSVARKSAGDTKEFRLECQGGCLTDCFDLMEVDPHRSVCNDPKYIELTYGIEAGRASMVKEMNTVLEETAYVDPHHVSLLVDWMGYTGSLRPVNRHTQNKIKSAGVIDRSTNEETMAVLSEGAMNARSDELKGISGQLATGRLVHAGTGVMQMRIPLPNI